MRLFKKIFYQYAYAIGCRKISLDEGLPCHSKPVEYKTLMPTETRWFADPFCFNYMGKDYIFFEIFSIFRERGTIGFSVFDGKKFTQAKEVLHEPFHLSYPNIFMHNGHIYMIPETHEAKQIILYEAIDFPYNWKRKVILVDDIDAVDTSYIQISQEEWILYTHDLQNTPRLKAFRLNWPTMKCTPVEILGASHERPAGNPITIDGISYRVLQDCSRCYGEKIKLYKINNLSVKDYREEYAADITVNMLDTNSRAHFERVHTITRSDTCESVDFCYERFYLTKPLVRLLLRAFRYAVGCVGEDHSR